MRISGSPLAIFGMPSTTRLPDICGAFHGGALAAVEVYLDAGLLVLHGGDYEALARRRPLFQNWVEFAVRELKADIVRVHGAFLVHSLDKCTTYSE